MQLRHDNAFGTVNDKGTVVGHERQFAHENFLFLDVLDNLAARRRCLVINDQTRQHAQGCCESQTANLAFAFVESRFTQTVADIVQLNVARVTDNGHDAVEGPMQAHFSKLITFLAFLKEVTVRIQLRLQQIRHLKNRSALSKIFTDAFFFSERKSHQRSSQSKGRVPGEHASMFLPPETTAGRQSQRLSACLLRTGESIARLPGL